MPGIHLPLASQYPTVLFYSLSDLHNQNSCLSSTRPHLLKMPNNNQYHIYSIHFNLLVQ